jgi:hypothetical protein
VTRPARSQSLDTLGAAVQTSASAWARRGRRSSRSSFAPRSSWGQVAVVRGGMPGGRASCDGKVTTDSRRVRGVRRGCVEAQRR